MAAIHEKPARVGGLRKVFVLLLGYSGFNAEVYKMIKTKVKDIFSDFRQVGRAVGPRMTKDEVVQRDFRKLEAKLGWRRALEYFTQADSLLDPSRNEVVEYRETGAVTLDKGVYTFHAFADLDLKIWRIAFTRILQDLREQIKN